MPMWTAASPFSDSSRRAASRASSSRACRWSSAPAFRSLVPCRTTSRSGTFPRRRFQAAWSKANTRLPRSARPHRDRLLREFGVLGFRFLENGQRRIGVLPQREKILVGGPGSVAIPGEVASARESQVGERGDGLVCRHTGVIEDLLEFVGCFGPFFRGQKCLAV